MNTSNFNLEGIFKFRKIENRSPLSNDKEETNSRKDYMLRLKKCLGKTKEQILENTKILEKALEEIKSIKSSDTANIEQELMFEKIRLKILKKIQGKSIAEIEGTEIQKEKVNDY